MGRGSERPVAHIQQLNVNPSNPPVPYSIMTAPTTMNFMAISITTQPEPEDKHPNVFLKVGFHPNVYQKNQTHE